MAAYRNPPLKQRFTHIARVDEQHLFAAEKLRPTQHPIPDNLLPIVESHDNGATWRAVPMRRTPGSWFYQKAHGEHMDWPPESIAQFRWEPPVLRVRYIDFWLHGRWGYVWDARYHPRWRFWTIRKVAVLRDDEPGRDWSKDGAPYLREDEEPS